MMRPRPHRQHPLWLAFIAHRVSGLALALFLPAHFWVLATALDGEAALDSAIAFAEHPLVKLAETVLVFLLAVHAFGGLRLLALELLPWSPRQKTLAAGAVGLSVLVSGTFLLQAV
ncbi:MAG: succinate dehydrogenase, cytochrome b556 subunit [Pseudomonadota bacterium]